VPDDAIHDDAIHDDAIHDDAIHDDAIHDDATQPASERKITVLCGGVGAARLLAGFIDVVPPSSITAIVNVGDDTEIHGLSISPDIDTIVYTLAGAIDPGRGWGLAGESWHALGALERYEGVRPPGSEAANRWFGLGDKDLATHLYRTQRRLEGATLTTITAEIVRAWGLGLTILPMTDDRVRTFVTTAEHGRIPFQEFFVRYRHSLAALSIDFEGASKALASTEAIKAIRDADLVVIAPSNPLVSIGPILAIDEVRSAIEGSRSRVVAVSPIIAGKALKGPADHMMASAGIEVSAAGVAAHYRTLAATLIIDDLDADLSAAVTESGVRPIVTNTVMVDREHAAALCRTILQST
jgi:LPPG:FO 2-phospho-L-lactate transferase